MTMDVKIEPTKPLPSEELEQDAREAGVEPEQQTDRDGDTHVPASESGAVDGGARSDDVERDVANLPPD